MSKPSKIKQLLRNPYTVQILCLLTVFMIVASSVFFGISFFNQFTPAIYTAEDRITHVITWLNPAVLILVLALYMQASSKHTDADDDPKKMAQQDAAFHKFISNSSQHLFVFTLALLQFSLYVPKTLLGLVPIFALLFCLSRFLYLFTFTAKTGIALIGTYLSLFLSIIMLLYGFKLLVNWGALLNIPLD